LKASGLCAARVAPSRQRQIKYAVVERSGEISIIPREGKA